MSKRLTSIRLPEITDRQLAELASATGLNTTELITTAIDRMYREEIKMKTYIVTNDRYSNEPVPATLNDLRQLAAENGWAAEFTETTRNGRAVIIDNRNEIVAEAE